MRVGTLCCEVVIRANIRYLLLTWNKGIYRGSDAILTCVWFTFGSFTNLWVRAGIILKTSVIFRCIVSPLCWNSFFSLSVLALWYSMNINIPNYYSISTQRVSRNKFSTLRKHATALKIWDSILNSTLHHLSWPSKISLTFCAPDRDEVCYGIFSSYMHNWRAGTITRNCSSSSSSSSNTNLLTWSSQESIF